MDDLDDDMFDPVDPLFEVMGQTDPMEAYDKQWSTTRDLCQAVLGVLPIAVSAADAWLYN